MRLAVLLTVALASALLRPEPASAQLIDENLCWQDWACSNWLWEQLQDPRDRGRPNPLAVLTCTTGAPPPTDPESCIADLASRRGAAAYNVCLWGAQGTRFPECPPYSYAAFLENYPMLDPLDYCGSRGCTPPSLRDELGLLTFYRR
jgi:hypothetical protein